MSEKFFGKPNHLPKSKLESAAPRIASPILLKSKKDLEQNHLLLATPFTDAKNSKRYAATLLGNILGGGTSSRLWQKIREENGFAYSVGASAIPYRDCGVFQIFAATSPENSGKTIDLCIAELRKIKEEAVPEEELQLAKDQISSSLLLGLEDSGVRAGNLAANEMFFGKQISIEETLLSINKVHPEEIRIWRRIFSN